MRKVNLLILASDMGAWLGLNDEIELFTPGFVKHFPAEHVELCWLVGYAFLLFVKRNYVLHAIDFLTEVALVKLRIEDLFVDVLQLCEGEFLGKQLETDRLVFHLVAQGD